MKKHFLLLLMALVSMTSWAQINIGGEGFQFKLAAPSIPYTGEEVDVDETLKQSDYETALVLDQDYELVFFDKDDAQLDEVPVAVGTYKVQAKGIEPSYTGTTQKITFNITKGNIDLDEIEGKKIPQAKAGLTYNGTEKTLIDDSELNAPSIPAAYGKFEYSLDNANWFTTLPKGTDAGTYTVYWRINGEPNYNNYVADDNEIEAEIAPMSTDGLFVEVTGLPEDAVTYSGSEQLISGVKVTIKEAEEDEDALIEYENPVIKYYLTNGRGEVENNEATSVTNAGTYYLQIVQPEGANYGFVLDGTTEADQDGYTYTIDEKDITFSLGTYSKTFDGYPIALEGDHVNIINSGLAAGDAGATIGGLAAIPTADQEEFGEEDVNAGKYGVKVNGEAITITKTVPAPTQANPNATVEVDVTANYNIIAPEKLWTIEKKELHINAKEKSIAVGTAPNDEDVVLEFEFGEGEAVVIADEEDETYNRDDATDLAAYFEAVYDAEVISETQQASEELVPQTFENAIKVAFDDAEAEHPLLANYEPVYGTANLIIQGNDFTIVPSVANVEYGTDAVKDYNAYNEDYSAASVDESTLKYQYKLKDAEAWTAWDETNKPTEIGDYMVRFDPEQEIAGADANVGGEASSTTVSVFSITKKTITIAISDVELWNGATKTDLNDKIVTPEYELVGDEQINFEYSFKAGVAGLTVGDEASDFAITFGDTWADETAAITAELVDAEGFDNDHYNVIFVDGALTQTDLEALDLTLDDADEDLQSLIAEAAAVCAANEEATYDVAFTARELKKGEWTTMWLPFNTTVSEVSAALGYALVDMLKEDPESDDLNFKIQMGDIPAYTPFLVKTAETINLAGVEEAQAPVVFEGVRIVAPIEANMTKENKSYYFKSNPVKQVIGESFWTAGSKMANDGFEFNKYKATATLKALRAYIIAKEGVSAAPRIFIEEADGTTTAISAVKNETNMNAEGWYTIGGMKLQGAPTQKGVFIQNGKKVVVK